MIQGLILLILSCLAMAGYMLLSINIKKENRLPGTISYIFLAILSSILLYQQFMFIG